MKIEPVNPNIIYNDLPVDDVLEQQTDKDALVKLLEPSNIMIEKTKIANEPKDKITTYTGTAAFIHGHKKHLLGKENAQVILCESYIADHYIYEALNDLECAEQLKRARLFNEKIQIKGYCKRTLKELQEIIDDFKTIGFSENILGQQKLLKNSTKHLEKYSDYTVRLYYEILCVYITKILHKKPLFTTMNQDILDTLLSDILEAKPTINKDKPNKKEEAAKLVLAISKIGEVKETPAKLKY